MPAAATQSAPQRKAVSPQRASQKQQNAPEQKPGMAARLRDLPQAAGIAIMALLLVVSLFVGNARALQKATPANFLKRQSVTSIVEDRAAQARNAVSVAERAFGDGSQRVQDAVAQVNGALSDFEGAKDVRDLSRADQTLTSAVSELAAAANGGMNGEDAQMLQRALDNFAEQGSFLRQEARAYNQQAEKALKLYESLPAKFLLGRPGIYEGI